MTDLIPITTINENTKACIKATSNPCMQVIIGKPNGNANHNSLVPMIVNPIIDTLSKMDPEDILPNSLMDNDTILDTIPIISKKPTNKEIIMSPIFAPIPSPWINHLPPNGIYSYIVCHKPSCFHCMNKVAHTAIKAKARLNSNSAVGAVTRLNH